MKWKLKLKQPFKTDRQQREGKWQAKMETSKRRLAAWLQQQSEKLSIRSKKIILVGCCLLFGSFMIWRMISGLGADVLHRSRIMRPVLVTPLPKLNIDTTNTDSIRQ